MPALATISGNTVVDLKEGEKAPTRRTPILLESSPNNYNRKSQPALRRSQRRRKSTVLFGLENNNIEAFSNKSNSIQSPSAVKRARRRRKSTVLGLENSLYQFQMNQQQEQQRLAEEDKQRKDSGQNSSLFAPDHDSGSPLVAPTVDNRTEIDRSDTHSKEAVMGAYDQSGADTDTEQAGNHLSLSSTMESANEQTVEMEKLNSSQPSSSNTSQEENLTIAPIETDTKAASPEIKSTPSGVIASEAVSPALPKSRLSLLLLLRPPPPTQKSIVRRKCVPVKDGDGTAREQLTSNPTSNRHFDALATFEALSSTIPRAATAFQKNASGDEILVIDPETLHERLNTLFPEQFPKPSEMAATKRRARSSEMDNQFRPPCIFPRLVASYTIYRDYQRECKLLEHREHTETSSPTSIFSSPKGNESTCTRSPKRLRTTGGMNEIEATLSTPSSDAVESLSLIRNLLQKLVDLEWVILQGHEHSNEDAGKSTTFNPVKPEIKATFPSCWRTPERKKFNKELRNQSPRRRRIQFAAFGDKAVVTAPSDVLEDSYKPQERCISALISVLNAVEEVFPKAISSSPTPLIQDAQEQRSCSNAAAIVRDFIFYLNNEFIPQCHDTICVESLMAIEKQNIPALRVQKAAATYARDLDSLINPNGKMIKQLLASTDSIEQGISDDKLVVPLSIQTRDVFVRSSPLTWECRLSNASGQHVRYWLRTLMNDHSERTDFDTKTDQWKRRLLDYVNLTDIPDEDEDNIKVNESITIYDEGEAERSIPIDEDACSGTDSDDLNLSSLLSNALLHVYTYLKLGADQSALSDQGLSWRDRLKKEIPGESCCATTVCQDGFGTSRKPVYFTEEDWQDLREEIEAASYFCAFHRRALFIERLLSIVELLDMTDYWTSTVQAAAQNLVKMKASINNSNNYAISLDKPLSDLGNTDGDANSNPDCSSVESVVCDRAVLLEDEHLVLLGLSPRELLVRLRTEILPLTCRRYEVCRANLRKTEKKFRLGGTNTAAKKRFQPKIGELEDHWKVFLEEITRFPSISMDLDD